MYIFIQMQVLDVIVPIRILIIVIGHIMIIDDYLPRNIESFRYTRCERYSYQNKELQFPVISWGSFISNLMVYI